MLRCPNQPNTTFPLRLGSGCAEKRANEARNTTIPTAACRGSLTTRINSRRQHSWAYFPKLVESSARDCRIRRKPMTPSKPVPRILQHPAPDEDRQQPGSNPSDAEQTAPEG